jgi:hypothetical protein
MNAIMGCGGPRSPSPGNETSCVNDHNTLVDGDILLEGSGSVRHFQVRELMAQVRRSAPNDTESTRDREVGSLGAWTPPVPRAGRE